MLAPTHFRDKDATFLEQKTCVDEHGRSGVSGAINDRQSFFLQVSIPITVARGGLLSRDLHLEQPGLSYFEQRPQRRILSTSATAVPNKGRGMDGSGLQSDKTHWHKS